jgi:hypothetical protein
LFAATVAALLTDKGGVMRTAIILALLISKRTQWCESVKARGIEQFVWGPLFVKEEQH